MRRPKADTSLQLSLDFGDWDGAGAAERKEEKAVDWRTLPYFPTARNDNERLLNLQRDYRSGDRNALSEMYLLGKKVSARLCRAEMRKRGLSNVPVEDNADAAIVYVIERLMTHRGFALRVSFVAYLYMRIRHEMYYRTRADEIVDFVDLDSVSVSTEDGFRVCRWCNREFYGVYCPHCDG